MSPCLVIQHVAAESPYAVADALTAAGVAVDVRRTDLGDEIPDDPASLDGLVVMGGPMSASSDHGYPTRGAEIELLAGAIERGLPTVGICLGAQLLAVAGGARSFPGGCGPEIGWGPIELTAAGQGDGLLAGLPERLEVLHWHGDTFDLPADAHLLATNGRYVNQAFRLGQSAWGLQFHLEVTDVAVRGFLEAFPEEAETAPGGIEAVRAATTGALSVLAPLQALVFARFAALVRARAERRTEAPMPLD